MTAITSTEKPATTTRDLVCSRQSASAAATVVVAISILENRPRCEPKPADPGRPADCSNAWSRGSTWIRSGDASDRLRNSSRSSRQYGDTAPAAFHHDDTLRLPHFLQAPAMQR